MNGSTHRSLLTEQAIAILRNNDRGGYTVPTHGLYPFQWNWDSVFVALGLAEFDRPRAWTELHTLVSGQWDDGLIPHIVFHQDNDGYFPGPSVWATGTTPATSGIANPPVLATIVRKLWEDEGSDPHHQDMRALYQSALASHRWFHRFRDPLKNGLVLVTHNWESGRDNSSEWDGALARVDTTHVEPYTRRDLNHVDSAMRPTNAEYDSYTAIVQFGRDHGWDHAEIAANGPFKMIDVGMSMMLLRANRDLLVMAEALGDTPVVTELRDRIALSETGIESLWDENVGAYCSVDLTSGASSGVVTSASFLGFMVGVGSPERREQLLHTLKRVSAVSEYLVPSLEPGARLYDHRRYWRGPVWLVVNYLVAQGLAEAGHTGWSEKVREDSAKLIERSGFFEAFSPETGAGSGGNDFAWSAAMWLAWCGKPSVSS